MADDDKFEKDLAAYRAKHHQAYLARKRQELANTNPPTVTNQTTTVVHATRDQIHVHSKANAVPTSSPPPLRAPLTARTPSIQRQHAASQPNVLGRPTPLPEKTSWVAPKTAEDAWTMQANVGQAGPSTTHHTAAVKPPVAAPAQQHVTYVGREQRPNVVPPTNHSQPSPPQPVVTTTRTYVPAQPARRITNSPSNRDQPSHHVFRGNLNAQVAADSELARKLQEEEDARIAASLAGMPNGTSSPTRPPEAPFRERLIHDTPSFPAHNLAAPRPVRTAGGNHLTLNPNQATVVENIGGTLRTNPLTTYAATSRRSPPPARTHPRLDFADLDEEEQIRITLAESRREYELKHGPTRR